MEKQSFLDYLPLCGNYYSMNNILHKHSIITNNHDINYRCDGWKYYYNNVKVRQIVKYYKKEYNINGSDLFIVCYQNDVLANVYFHKLIAKTIGEILNNEYNSLHSSYGTQLSINSFFNRNYNLHNMVKSDKERSLFKNYYDVLSDAELESKLYNNPYDTLVSQFKYDYMYCNNTKGIKSILYRKYATLYERIVNIIDDIYFLIIRYINYYAGNYSIFLFITFINRIYYIIILLYYILQNADLFL